MTQKILPKGVILSDSIAIFVMSVAGSFISLSNTKISEFCDMTKTEQHIIAQVLSIILIL